MTSGVTSETDCPSPAEQEGVCNRRVQRIRWRHRPLLVPLVASVVSVGGVGAFGYLALRASPGGWLAGRGVPIPDSLGLLVVTGLGVALVFIAGVTAGSRMRALLGIRASLLAFARGERCEGALRVVDEPGSGAAWNELLNWREAGAETAATAALLRAESGGDRASEHATDALWHGLMIVDDQQIIRYANGASAVFLRQRRDALAGVNISRVVTDEAVAEAIRVAAETGSRQRRVIDIGDATAPDSSVLRFSVRATGAANNRAVLIVIEDVTQQRISDAVQHAFVAQATHELRTPLTNMKLYLEQLIDDTLSDEERGTAMNVINQEITRLDHIVGDMLSIAEIQAGGLSSRRGDVRIEQMLEHLEHDYAESTRQKGLTLTFDLPPKFPMIQGDRDKIGIVLHNLLGNALKYTPSGGSIRVAVREEGDRLVVDVTDTGIGISEEDAGRIFERFVRGQDPRALRETGTGLGLALARDIARMHAGEITLHSELDVGSTFSFWLPIVPGTVAQAA